MTTLLVGGAGLAGVMTRYGLTRLTIHTEALLWTTVGINVVGSFLLGLLAAEHWFSRDMREALGVGFLGGFTTFSTFALETDRLLDRAPGVAVLYVALSLLLGLSAAAVGMRLGERRV